VASGFCAHQLSVAVGIACTNSASRVMYTMGAPALYLRVRSLHPVISPLRWPSARRQVIEMISILMIGLLLRPDYIFNFLGTVRRSQ